MARVLTLMGPTAAGKTETALRVADAVDVDIISVDSSMIYRGMDVGTAKPDGPTLAKYPHALVDVREPSEVYSAAEFVADADLLVVRALERNRVPLLVGGTMLYFKAFRDGLSNLPSADAALRAQLSAEARQRGWPAMHEMLRAVDPLAAQRIHPNNPQRIARALEVYRASGKPMSQWFEESRGRSASERLGVDVVETVLEVGSRKSLHEIIGTRFDAMLDAGLVEEVRCLRGLAGVDVTKPSARSVGYRQVWAYLDGRYGFDEMRERGVIATRQLAKKQLTWLRRWPDVTHLEAQPRKAAGAILKLL
ncbi:MAG: tRNA (adenosine(37)-N6)-dimethylallyltransferase MiaA [Gammaproteobacteria bacterium]|nr:tRNA (adenosine(37)-N6)-dimethylallyltransferase MiaA [Gammaproteobacteria bacterium]